MFEALVILVHDRDDEVSECYISGLHCSRQLQAAA